MRTRKNRAQIQPYPLYTNSARRLLMKVATKGFYLLTDSPHTPHRLTES